MVVVKESGRKIPAWFIKQFPRDKKDTIQTFLDDMLYKKIREDKDPWSGFKKFSEGKKRLIMLRITRGVWLKAEGLVEQWVRRGQPWKVLVLRHEKGEVVEGEKVGGRIKSWIPVEPVK